MAQSTEEASSVKIHKRIALAELARVRVIVHIPFEIDESARQVWLSCFMKVLESADKKYNFPMQHMAGFKDFLEGFSAWMVNKA